MATISEIRERIAVVLAPLGLTVVTRPQESTPEALPAVVLGEPSAEFAEGGDARRGLDRWEIPLLLLVPCGEYDLSSEVLDAYLERTGDTSIRQAFARNPSLGLLDGTSAWLDRADNYGPRASGEQAAAGVVLYLVVRTSG